jgi:hypothetical protein
MLEIQHRRRFGLFERAADAIIPSMLDAVDPSELLENAPHGRTRFEGRRLLMSHAPPPGFEPGRRAALQRGRAAFAHGPPELVAPG